MARAALILSSGCGWWSAAGAFGAGPVDTAKTVAAEGQRLSLPVRVASVLGVRDKYIALEVLDPSSYSVRREGGGFFGQGHPPQADAISGSSKPAQPEPRPERSERVTNVVARLREEGTPRLRSYGGCWLGIAPLLGAEPAEQHIVGVGVLGVQLQALTLEPLYEAGPVADLLSPRG